MGRAGDLFRVYYRLLLSDRLEGRTVNATDESSVQITDTTGQVTGVEFDPQTHLPKRVSYDTQQAAGPPIYSEDVYEDFRDIGGIKVPFKITINQGGGKFSDVVVKDYKINTGLSPLALARRPQCKAPDCYVFRWRSPPAPPPPKPPTSAANGWSMRLCKR
ncbi:MAG: hypothetical protein NTW28_23145 [Candidatus Solibacter sp.]|nr:hypothetical protein [Candidatus Solibacter sp.]